MLIRQNALCLCSELCYDHFDGRRTLTIYRKRERRVWCKNVSCFSMFCINTYWLVVFFLLFLVFYLFFGSIVGWFWMVFFYIFHFFFSRFPFACSGSLWFQIFVFFSLIAFCCRISWVCLWIEVKDIGGGLFVVVSFIIAFFCLMIDFVFLGFFFFSFLSVSS